MKLKYIYAELLSIHDFADNYPCHVFYSHLVFDKPPHDLLADKFNKKYNAGLPFFRGSPTGYDKGRQIPLTGEEDIAGDFLLLEYVAHYPEITLIQLDSVPEIEELLISTSGVLNPFTTLQIPIINNKLKRYAIEYLDKETSAVCVLNLANYAKDTDIDLHKTENRKIIWLE